MLLGFLLLILVTLGGVGLTYLYDDDATISVRLASGLVLGNILVGLLGLLLALVFDLNSASVTVATAICALPLFVFRRADLRRRLRADLAGFESDRRRFFGRFDVNKLLIALAYVGLFLMLWFFYDRAMLTARGVIGTGSPHNIGDLAFHLQSIYGFVAGDNFPPQSPMYAGATFTYPFIADLVTSMMVVLGAGIAEAMFWQNLLLTTALVILLHRFTLKITGNRTAAVIAPFLLLFSGGLGFLMFVRDAVAAENGVLGHLLSMTNDYTIRFEGGLRWGNALATLFLTQRSLSLGLPFALIVLTKVWEIFSGEKVKSENGKEVGDETAAGRASTLFPFPLLTFLPYFIIGFFAGMLPLVHAHSFAVVMGMTGLLALLSLNKWREWTVFFLAAAIVAVPELLWATMNSATKADTFINWKFGWDNGEGAKAENVIWFWLKNIGLFIPLLVLALGWLGWLAFSKTTENTNREIDENGFEPHQPNRAGLISGLDRQHARRLLLFYAPFLLCFIIPNIVRLAPWVWDNIKVLIYWYVISVPLVAWVLAMLWQRGGALRVVSLVLLFGLIVSGWLDVWRVSTRQIDNQIFNQQVIAVAAQVRERTAPHSLIMSAPTYNSVAVLTGRRWFLGYTGHLWSHGVNPTERESVIKRIYAGAPEAQSLIRQHNIEYVVVSPLEREYTTVNAAFFSIYPIVAEAGEYRVYRVSSGQR